MRRYGTTQLFLAAILVGCLQSPAPVAPLPAGGTHVLFIGNSLTYVNNLPATLARLAELSGDTVRVSSVALPNYALVDHVNEGTAMRTIRAGGWQYVVLQQGPSSVQANRDSLIMMTQLFDASIRAVGGKTALYSVWPQLENYSTFARAIESYRLAAQSVSGTYLPVGAAWLAAAAKDPNVALYSADGLHPTVLGTYLAALVMYERLLGKDARQLPAQAVADGAVLTGIPEQTIRLLQAAAHEANALPSAVRQAADRQPADGLAETLDSLRRAVRIPGMAVVVLRDTTVVLARGFGYANIEHVVPVTPETPFNIASVTKTISAVVALRLVEQGRLDLDRPMNDYDGFADFCNSARDAGGTFFSDFTCTDRTMTLRHVLSMRVNGVPGSRFFYNPPSYSWASRPMAQVSGTTFSGLTAALVFAPAGMRQSARIHRRLALPPAMASQLAIPYHTDSAGHTVPSEPPGPQGDGAAGGVVSTAMDLARFDIALTQGRLLSPASQRTMWTAGRSPTGAVLPYGLGWFIKDLDGEQLLWHTGLWEGAYSALYLKVPARHLTLILLANSDGLRWDSALDEAALERSPFAAAFLAAFPR